MSCTTYSPPGLSRRITKLAQAAVTLFVVAVAAPVFLNASALNGNLSLSSAGSDTVAVNGGVIEFDFMGGVSMGFPPIATSGAIDGTGDSGLFDVTAASNGSFAAPIVGTTVTVHDLNAADEPVGSTTGPDLPLTNFITFAAQSGWSIQLTEILPGDEGAAGCVNPTGTQCTPPGSPFNLIDESGDQVLVGFSFLGTATDGTGDVSTVAGTFSTTFSDTTYQAILADLASGDTIVSSATATIGITPVPEPGSLSMLLLGCGLVASSAIYRRYQRR